jgi:hypothetical protein
MRSSLAAQEKLAQQGGFDGLGEVKIESGLGGTVLVGFLSPARDGDECHGRFAAAFTNATRDVVARKPRHADVENRDVGLQLSKQLQRLESVMRDVHFVAIESQQHGESFTRIQIVVGHEHAPLPTGIVVR